MISALEQVIEWRGQPDMLRCDNGPEYISGVMQGWAEQRGIRLDYILPGKSSADCVHRALQPDHTL